MEHLSSSESSKDNQNDKAERPKDSSSSAGSNEWGDRPDTRLIRQNKAYLESKTVNKQDLFGPQTSVATGSFGKGTSIISKKSSSSVLNTKKVERPQDISSSGGSNEWGENPKKKSSEILSNQNQTPNSLKLSEKYSFGSLQNMSMNKSMNHSKPSIKSSSSSSSLSSSSSSGITAAEEAKGERPADESSSATQWSDDSF